jgi:hypothetical protein
VAFVATKTKIVPDLTGPNGCPNDVGRGPMTHQKLQLVKAIPNLFFPSKTDISFRRYILPKEMSVFERPTALKVTDDPHAVWGGAFAPQFLLRNVRGSVAIPMQKTPHQQLFSSLHRTRSNALPLPSSRILERQMAGPMLVVESEVVIWRSGRPIHYGDGRLHSVLHVRPQSAAI